MAILDERNRVVVLRIVYAGPPLSGKTETVRSLCTQLSSARQPGEVYTPDEAGARTLFFDWLEYAGGSFHGRTIRCQIVAVPGQSMLYRRRQLLLQSADAVVFVVDSRPEHAEAIAASYQEMRRFIEKPGESYPVGVIVQANKTDLPDAMAKDALRELLGSGPEIAIVPTIATQGTGLRETFVQAVGIALERVRALMDADQLIPSAGPAPVETGEELLLRIKALEDAELGEVQRVVVEILNSIDMPLPAAGDTEPAAIEESGDSDAALPGTVEALDSPVLASPVLAAPVLAAPSLQELAAVEDFAEPVPAAALAPLTAELTAEPPLPFTPEPELPEPLPPLTMEPAVSLDTPAAADFGTEAEPALPFAAATGPAFDTEPEPLPFTAEAPRTAEAAPDFAPEREPPEPLPPLAAEAAPAFVTEQEPPLPFASEASLPFGAQAPTETEAQAAPENETDTGTATGTAAETQTEAAATQTDTEAALPFGTEPALATETDAAPAAGSEEAPAAAAEAAPAAVEEAPEAAAIPQEAPAAANDEPAESILREASEAIEAFAAAALPEQDTAPAQDIADSAPGAAADTAAQTPQSADSSAQAAEEHRSQAAALPKDAWAAVQAPALEGGFAPVLAAIAPPAAEPPPSAWTLVVTPEINVTDAPSAAAAEIPVTVQPPRDAWVALDMLPPQDAWTALQGTDSQGALASAGAAPHAPLSVYPPRGAWASVHVYPPRGAWAAVEPGDDTGPAAAPPAAGTRLTSRVYPPRGATRPPEPPPPSNLAPGNRAPKHTQGGAARTSPAPDHEPEQSAPAAGAQGSAAEPSRAKTQPPRPASAQPTPPPQPPVTPDKRVGAGMVWPPIAGRHVLNALSGGQPRLRQLPNQAWLGESGRWLLLSLPEHAFNSEVLAREEMLRLARSHSLLKPVLTEQRCVSCTMNWGSEWRIWQVVRRETTLADVLQLMHGLPTAESIVTELLRIAYLLGVALARFRAASLFCAPTLDKIAVSQGGPVYSGFVLPNDTTSNGHSETAGATGLIRRELQGAITALARRLELMPQLLRQLEANKRSAPPGDRVAETLIAMFLHTDTRT